ncbi:MAG: hypothetical protein KF801_09540 [Cryobacterium sp.]|nr:hypothetical protein [Cryobacterium sp.]
MSTSPAPGAIVTVPFIVTLALAISVLVGIGVAVRRLRANGTLTLANASTSAAAAAFVIAAALLAVVSTGTVSPAVAANVPVHAVTVSNDDGFQPIVIQDLEGYQLPTK